MQTNKQPSISHGMVIPSTRSDKWTFTYHVDGEEREAAAEFNTAAEAKRAMREQVEMLRDHLED